MRAFLTEARVADQRAVYPPPLFCVSAHSKTLSARALDISDCVVPVATSVLGVGPGVAEKAALADAIGLQMGAGSGEVVQPAWSPGGELKNEKPEDQEKTAKAVGEGESMRDVTLEVKPRQQEFTYWAFERSVGKALAGHNVRTKSGLRSFEQVAPRASALAVRGKANPEFPPWWFGAAWAGKMALATSFWGYNARHIFCRVGILSPNVRRI